MFEEEHEEVVLDQDGKRHKPSKLGLKPKDPSKYFNRSHTRTCLDALLGMVVDMMNKDGKIQASWKIVQEAKEGSKLME